ncbi:MAG: hypothetical protein H0X70_06620 [Segetibacter sp.]|nr:hypothetical protein [Segetibacter sp.]
MKKILLTIFICALLSVSCTKDKNETGNRNYDYFNSNLKAGMVFTEIKSTFDEPESICAVGFIFMFIDLKSLQKSA